MSLASILRDRLYRREIAHRLHPVGLWRIGDDLSVHINGVSVGILSHATRVLEPLGYELTGWGTEGASYAIPSPVLRFAPRTTIQGERPAYGRCAM
ncbi:MAG: hypothetical protein M3440_06445 [Chloroflexota bacterium]|nr:hypothetical protein [Chloroflexota bacterium]